MTTLEYLEKVDDTLAHWEDYFHGQEGTDVTEARFNLNKVRQQLVIDGVVVPKGTLCEHEPLHSATETVDYCPACGLYQPSK